MEIKDDRSLYPTLPSAPEEASAPEDASVYCLQKISELETFLEC